MSNKNRVKRRSARVPTGPAITPDPRTVLIARGCDGDSLDNILTLIKSVRTGKNASFPTQLDQLMVEPTAIGQLRSRIEALAKELEGLWTPEGRAHVHEEMQTRWMLQQPDLLRKYSERLDFFRHVTSKRLPAFPSALKSWLVGYVYRMTAGRHGWHDAELAELCGEKVRAWAKWRKLHYRKPVFDSSEPNPVIPNIPPISES